MAKSNIDPKVDNKIDKSTGGYANKGNSSSFAPTKPQQPPKPEPKLPKDKK